LRAETGRTDLHHGRLLTKKTSSQDEHRAGIPAQIAGYCLLLGDSDITQVNEVNRSSIRSLRMLHRDPRLFTVAKVDGERNKRKTGERDVRGKTQGDLERCGVADVRVRNPEEYAGVDYGGS
jgi:hypothetical protein